MARRLYKNPAYGLQQFEAPLMEARNRGEIGGCNCSPSPWQDVWTLLNFVVPIDDCASVKVGACALGVASLLPPGKALKIAKLLEDASKVSRAAKDAAAVESRTYVDLTKGGSIRNVGTDATHSEFSDTLSNAGWAARASKDGAVQIFEKDGARYVLRSNADSYSGWTADFYPAGSGDITLKLRLGYQP